MSPGQGGKREATPGLKARLVAVHALTAIINKRQAFGDALAGDHRYADLSASDRAFVQALTYAVLRHLPWLDTCVARHLRKALPKKQAAGRQLLRMGAAQLLILDTPAHAAVHSSVALTGTLKLTPLKGLVNAVLRRVAEDKAAGTLPPEPLWLPEWLQQRLSAAYGGEGAERLAAAARQEPPLDLTVKADAIGWAERLQGQALGGHTVRLQGGGEVPALPGYAEGTWWVQDVAASLPVQLLQSVAGGLQGKRVLDACAAPGGKTLQLAAAGAEVTAVDKSVVRLERLRENLVRTGLAARVEVVDLLEYRPSAAFLLMLLDAPCSATGTLRRHPDVLYTKTPEDIAMLARLQHALLDRALGWLAPGGMLLYCTCSLQPEEGEAQAEAFLARHVGTVREVPFTPAMLPYPGAEAWLTEAGYLRTLPHFLPAEGGMDGFFAACFERVR